MRWAVMRWAVMRSTRSFSTALLIGATAIVAACSDGLPAPIIEGRSGGELRDEGCDWSLVPSTNTTGVDFTFERLGGSGGSTVWPQGADDPVWLAAIVPCVDAPEMVFGGVDERADSVVMIRPDGERFEPELFEVEDRTWNAVLVELPPQWLVGGGFDVEIVASADGEELGRSTLRRRSG